MEQRGKRSTSRSPATPTPYAQGKTRSTSQETAEPYDFTSLPLPLPPGNVHEQDVRLSRPVRRQEERNLAREQERGLPTSANTRRYQHQNLDLAALRAVEEQMQANVQPFSLSLPANITSKHIHDPHEETDEECDDVTRLPLNLSGSMRPVRGQEERSYQGLADIRTVEERVRAFAPRSLPLSARTAHTAREQHVPSVDDESVHSTGTISVRSTIPPRRSAILPDVGGQGERNLPSVPRSGTVVSEASRTNSGNPAWKAGNDRPFKVQTDQEPVTRPEKLVEKPRQSVAHADHTHKPHAHWLVFVGLGMLTMVAVWVGLTLLTGWWQVIMDDWHYGRPRTYQVDAVVGHHDSAANPSHFIALNLNHHIEIIEFPGGDPTQAKVYIGPTLLGSGQDLTVVTLTFKDLNGDGKPDMVINIGDSHFVFINDAGQFRPARPGELGS